MLHWPCNSRCSNIFSRTSSMFEYLLLTFIHVWIWLEHLCTSHINASHIFTYASHIHTLALLQIDITINDCQWLSMIVNHCQWLAVIDNDIFSHSYLSLSSDLNQLKNCAKLSTSEDNIEFLELSGSQPMKAQHCNLPSFEASLAPMYVQYLYLFALDAVRF